MTTELKGLVDLHKNVDVLLVTAISILFNIYILNSNMSHFFSKFEE